MIEAFATLSMSAVAVAILASLSLDQVHKLVVIISVCVGGLAWSIANGIAFSRKLKHIVDSVNGLSRMKESMARIESSVTVLTAGRHAMWSEFSLGVFECDSTGSCTFASPYLSEIFGMPQSEMRGIGWLEAIDGPEERTRVLESWTRSISSRSPYSDTYKVHNRRTGDRWIMRAEAKAVIAPDGDPIYFFGKVEPIHRIRNENSDGTPIGTKRKTINHEGGSSPDNPPRSWA